MIILYNKKTRIEPFRRVKIASPKRQLFEELASPLGLVFLFICEQRIDKKEGQNLKPSFVLNRT